MKTDYPALRHQKRLRQLWQTAFGDTDDFLDSFYDTAFALENCLCIFENDGPVAVLYWIDCHLEDRKLAYIYAVVTDPAHRGKGLCRRLMERTHDLLRRRGYAGAVLVPQQEGLRAMYAGMGYTDCGGLSRISCTAGDSPVFLRAIGPEEFAALRRRMLPERAVVQEGRGLAFLARQLQFYAGDDFLLAAFAEAGILHGMELLGNPAAAPGITAALGCRMGHFRIPGNSPFAMFHPLIENIPAPEYFGFAFD